MKNRRSRPVREATEAILNGRNIRQTIARQASRQASHKVSRKVNEAMKYEMDPGECNGVVPTYISKEKTPWSLVYIGMYDGNETDYFQSLVTKDTWSLVADFINDDRSAYTPSEEFEEENWDDDAGRVKPEALDKFYKDFTDRIRRGDEEALESFDWSMADGHWDTYTFLYEYLEEHVSDEVHKKLWQAGMDELKKSYSPEGLKDLYTPYE